MSEKSSLMLTKFIFENCLDEKIRYDQRIINSIFNNSFITYELKRPYYHDNLRKALKEMYGNDVNEIIYKVKVMKLILLN